MSRIATALLDLDALTHNFSVARQAAAGRRVMAVVKANAYGHGLLPVARALKQADGLAVAFLEEALQLREAGIRQPILVLQGFRTVEQLEWFAQLDLMATLHHPWQLEALEQQRLAHPIQCWLKLDSGMGRLGFPLQEARAIYARLQCCANVAGEIGLMSHMACADDLDDPFTAQQLSCFEQATAGLNGPRSLANSAALLGWPESRGDWVRPGIMLYGGNPFVHGVAADFDLQPVMQLRSALVAVKSLRRGDSVGYGRSWVAPADLRLGVVAIGYGDGYPRHAISETPLLVAGQRCRLIGRVSMDMVTVDLNPVPNARVGDEVVLWGRGLPVDEVAAAAGTISYELLCAASKNFPE